MIYSQHFLNFAFVEIKCKIGSRIKELRGGKQMSQKDLSYAANLDRSYIASVENGQRNISIINLEKISKALDVSLSNLFKDL